ncbi:hypothetical protein ElyMa_000682800 [Elysia marginata]|uniref:Uncharacterized protein n=1 Tax=Elysia marginata TaxID=1093978 RepID=A0AAV4GIS8_9GAST|nr:hypothetical protein ElyMa_000682800 [Elysia marginata]
MEGAGTGWRSRRRPRRLWAQDMAKWLKVTTTDADHIADERQRFRQFVGEALKATNILRPARIQPSAGKHRATVIQCEKPSYRLHHTDSYDQKMGSPANFLLASHDLKSTADYNDTAVETGSTMDVRTRGTDRPRSNRFRQFVEDNLFLLCNIVGIIVGFLLGLLVRSANLGQDGIMWLGDDESGGGGDDGDEDGDDNDDDDDDDDDDDVVMVIVMMMMVVMMI